MKMTEADVVWVPDREWSRDRDVPNRGNVRVERRGHWQRTRGDRWRPVTAVGHRSKSPTKKDRTRQLLAMFTLFNMLVVRDGITVANAHAAFLAIEEYREAHLAHPNCADCGLDTLEAGEWYMVHDEIWDEIWAWDDVLSRQILCIGCLEKRIGRRLTGNDFTYAPINNPPGFMSDRMRDRLATPPNKKFFGR
jgi:hypothetical protein